jgi:hypothetical protein
MAWKIVPLRHFFPLKVVPLIEVLLYFGQATKAEVQPSEILCDWTPNSVHTRECFER